LRSRDQPFELGAQSFDDAIANDRRRAFAKTRARRQVGARPGFANVSIDLIAGLPEQKMELGGAISKRLSRSR